jgi:acetate kinase
MDAAAAEPLIGVINAGSSSVKFSFYEGERRISHWAGRWDRRTSFGERDWTQS